MGLHRSCPKPLVEVMCMSKHRFPLIVQVSSRIFYHDLGPNSAHADFYYEFTNARVSKFFCSSLENEGYIPSLYQNNIRLALSGPGCYRLGSANTAGNFVCCSRIHNPIYPVRMGKENDSISNAPLPPPSGQAPKIERELNF